ncbi:MAG: protoporphyrinogen oxidase [Solirubrobacteraceae bacterium]
MTDDPVHLAVVGGGISGLAAAHRLISSAPPASLRVTVIEASDRFGGWIRTETFAGRPVDFGPDSLLVRTPWAAELCRELRIDDELVAPGVGGALLLSRGKLRTLPPGILAGLPNGPLPFVRSGLLGPLGLLRAALDLVLPRNAPRGDESIGALIRRRLGPQALERVIDPLLGGVHAGRTDELSLAATAPQIAAAAQADRSLLRGLRKTAPPAAPAGAAPKPVFMGPRAGMQRITDELVAVLSGVAELRTGTVVERIEPCSRGPRGAVDGVRLTVRAAAPAGSAPGAAADPSTETLDFDGVILAVPAAVAAGLVAPHAPAAAATLSELRYASVVQTALAYDPADLPALPSGTGFLVPRPEGTVMTACTLLDQKWPERRAALEAATAGLPEVGHGVGVGAGTTANAGPADAGIGAVGVAGAAGAGIGAVGASGPGEPVHGAVDDPAHGLHAHEPAGSAGAGVVADYVDGDDLRHAVVIKCSAGRVDDHRVDDLTDDQLVDTLHEELTAVLGPITGAPIAHRVFRVRGGLPQYAPGHLDRIATATAEVAGTLPGLTLTGAAYRGTSVPVCIREGRAAADAQLARLLPPA